MATTTIPTLPSFSSSSVVVDTTVIDSFATTYCEGNPASPSLRVADFFYSYLPLSSFDQVFQSNGSLTAYTLAQLLGNLYVSGYFGGIWLTGILFPGSAQTDVSGASLSFVDEIARFAKGPYSKGDAAAGDWLTWLQRLLGWILGDPGSQCLVTYCGNEISFAQNPPSSAMLMDRLSDHLTYMVSLCGYDLGFLLQMFAQMPWGLYKFSTGQCLLDFSSTSVDLATDLLGNWSGVIPNLLNPAPGTPWTALQSIMQEKGVTCVPWGEDVWELLLAQTNLTGSGFIELFNLGVKYQLLAQTITLAEMYALANLDDATGQLALILEACFVLWTGAFVIGRFSGNTSQPTVNC